MAYIPATNAIRLNVSVGSDSDFDARNREVGFTPVNGRCQLGYLGPKSASNGHRPLLDHLISSAEQFERNRKA